VRCAELRGFAAKISQAVENHREKFSLVLGSVVAASLPGSHFDAKRTQVQDIQRKGNRIAFFIPAVQYASASCDVAMRLRVLDYL